MHDKDSAKNRRKHQADDCVALRGHGAQRKVGVETQKVLHHRDSDRQPHQHVDRNSINPGTALDALVNVDDAVKHKADHCRRAEHVEIDQNPALFGAVQLDHERASDKEGNNHRHEKGNEQRVALGLPAKPARVDDAGTHLVCAKKQC